MGLENGDYIGDLNQNNPVTATDPVSEGAAHLRLVKRALRGSFPQFTGTQAAPKTVSLSEDQINDAALKLADNAFTGSNSFSQTVNFGSEIIAGNIVSGLGSSIFLTYDNDRRRAITISAQNAYRFGDSDLDTQLQGLSITAFHGASAQSVFRTVDRASGSLQIADSGGVFGNVAAIHKNQDWTGTNLFTGLTSMAVSEANDVLRIRNATSAYEYRFRASAGRLTFVPVIGSTYQFSREFEFDFVNGNWRMEGPTEFLGDGGNLSAKFASRDDGSMLIQDRNNDTRKVGFRNPGRRSVTASTTASQNDEGGIIQFSGTASGQTITLPALEADTTLRILHRGTQPLTIALGAGLNALEWHSGNGIQSGPRTLAGGSVMEITYRAGDAAAVFGNGIT